MRCPGNSLILRISAPRDINSCRALYSPNDRICCAACLVVISEPQTFMAAASAAASFCSMIWLAKYTDGGRQSFADPRKLGMIRWIAWSSFVRSAVKSCSTWPEVLNTAKRSPSLMEPNIFLAACCEYMASAVESCRSSKTSATNPCGSCSSFASVRWEFGSKLSIFTTGTFVTGVTTEKVEMTCGLWSSVT